MRLPLVLVPAMVAISLVAFNYATEEGRSTPLTGLWRPFFGLEHLLAAIGLGAWATVLKGNAFWALPVGFLIGAALGIAMAWQGQGELPYVGLMLLLSVVSLTLAVLLPVRMGLERAVALVSLFGFYHGYAYGSETVTFETTVEAEETATQP